MSHSVWVSLYDWPTKPFSFKRTNLVDFRIKFIVSDIILQTYQVLYSFACIYALAFSVSWYQGSYNHCKSSEKNSLDSSKDSQNRWNSTSNHFQISLFVMTLNVWTISNTCSTSMLVTDLTKIFGHQHPLSFDITMSNITISPTSLYPLCYFWAHTSTTQTWRNKIMWYDPSWFKRSCSVAFLTKHFRSFLVKWLWNLS